MHPLRPTESTWSTAVPAEASALDTLYDQVFDPDEDLSCLFWAGRTGGAEGDSEQLDLGLSILDLHRYRILQRVRSVWLLEELEVFRQEHLELAS